MSFRLTSTYPAVRQQNAGHFRQSSDSPVMPPV
jgi:hypothetical protein